MLPDERGGEGQRGTGEAVVLAGLWEAAGGARVSRPKRGSRSTAPTRVGAERLGRIFDRVSEVSGRVSERPKLPEGACRGTVASAALKHREGPVMAGHLDRRPRRRDRLTEFDQDPVRLLRVDKDNLLVVGALLRHLTRMRLMPRPGGRGGIRQSEGVSMAPSD